jgi:hypothetical protein
MELTMIRNHRFSAAAMLSAAWLFAGAGCAASAAEPTQAFQPAPPQAVTQQNAGISPLPVLFCDVSGSTFAGPAHMHMAVYANGLASISRKDQFVPADGDRVIETAIAPETVRELQIALRRAGAGRISPPLNLNTADIPLTTVTFFSISRPNALAHTFSYFDVPPQAAETDRLIREFIDRVFPQIRQ